MRAVNQDGVDLERQKMAILRIVAGSRRPVGSKIIARLLRQKDGIELSERGVRYHLNLMDERQLTTKVSRRDGRVITPQGLAEIEDGMVADKVGFVIDRIELLSYQVTFNPLDLSGLVPVNISLVPAGQLQPALEAMLVSVKAGLCASRLVAMAREGEKLGEIIIPAGTVGLATVCSLVINGTLLKAGIPIDSRFGGILQLRGSSPLRFTDLIEYQGSTMDPSEIFISGRMTAVNDAGISGNGKVLANFREVPSLCLEVAEKVFENLGKAGINPPFITGSAGRAVCGVPVGPGKVGLVLLGGLNPVAAAVETGVKVTSKAMNGLVEYRSLQDLYNLMNSL